MRQRLPDSIISPNMDHVNLRRFYEPTRVQELKSCILKWAAQHEPIELVLEGVNGFPPPFQILIARLERSRSLVDPYSALTSALDAPGFRRIGELPLKKGFPPFTRLLQQPQGSGVASRPWAVHPKCRGASGRGPHASRVPLVRRRENTEVISFSSHRRAATHRAAPPDMDGHAHKGQSAPTSPYIENPRSLMQRQPRMSPAMNMGPP